MRKTSYESKTAISTAIAAAVVIVIIVIAGAGILILSQHGNTSVSTSSFSSTTSSASSISSSSSSPTSIQSSSQSSSLSSTSSSEPTSVNSSSRQSSTVSYSGNLLVSFSGFNTALISPDVNLTYPMNVNSLGNLPASIILQSITSQGISVSFPSSPVSTGSQVSITAQLSAANGTSPGTYQIHDVALGGGGSVNFSISVQVVQYLVAIEPSFVPANLTIPAGSTVTWIRINGEIGEHENNGSANIVFNNQMATSPQLLQWQSWSLEFNQTGSFHYVNTYQSLDGNVNVVSS